MSNVATTTSTVASPCMQLPTVLQQHMLTFLPKGDICRMMRTNRTWIPVVCHPYVWQHTPVHVVDPDYHSQPNSTDLRAFWRNARIVPFLRPTLYTRGNCVDVSCTCVSCVILRRTHPHEVRITRKLGKTNSAWLPNSNLLQLMSQRTIHSLEIRFNGCKMEVGKSIFSVPLLHLKHLILHRVQYDYTVFDLLYNLAAAVPQLQTLSITKNERSYYDTEHVRSPRIDCVDVFTSVTSLEIGFDDLEDYDVSIERLATAFPSLQQAYFYIGDTIFLGEEQQKPKQPPIRAFRELKELLCNHVVVLSRLECPTITTLKIGAQQSVVELEHLLEWVQPNVYTALEQVQIRIAIPCISYVINLRGIDLDRSVMVSSMHEHCMADESTPTSMKMYDDGASPFISRCLKEIDRLVRCVKALLEHSPLPLCIRWVNKTDRNSGYEPFYEYVAKRKPTWTLES